MWIGGLTHCISRSTRPRRNGRSRAFCADEDSGTKSERLNLFDGILERDRYCIRFRNCLIVLLAEKIAGRNQRDGTSQSTDDVDISTGARVSQRLAACRRRRRRRRLRSDGDKVFDVCLRRRGHPQRRRRFEPLHWNTNHCFSF